MQLIIVRHGETEANTRGIIAGQSDTGLTEQGREQARRLGMRFMRDDIELIMSSDLRRARETTVEIMRYVNAPTQYKPCLRERSWGELEGLPVNAFSQAAEASGQPYHEYKPPGGESLLDLRERTRDFLNALEGAGHKGSVLISGHHSVNKMLLMCLFAWEWDKWREIRQGNACASIVELDERRTPRLVILNCGKHLHNGVEAGSSIPV